MATFERAIPTTLLHEGRYVDDKSDSGQATNYGISLRFLRQVGDLDHDGWPDGDIDKDGHINARDIQLLKKDEAIRLYRLTFWDKNGYEKIADQFVATKIFDLAVNMGSYQANKVAQRAVRSVVGIILVEDGHIGLKSITALNMCKPDRLLPALKSEASAIYRMIVARNAKMEKYLEGWLTRAYSNIILTTD